MCSGIELARLNAGRAADRKLACRIVSSTQVSLLECLVGVRFNE